MVLKLEVIAHRGFSAIAPENTLAAFNAAIQQGANSIEFDLQISADGVPVIFHDATLDRITGTSGKIRNQTLEQLKQLDAGRWFKPQYIGETIPTLAEALQTLKLVEKFLYFDVKPHDEWLDSEIETLLQLLKEHKILHQCIITSFNETFLNRVRQICPEIMLGYFLVNIADAEAQLDKALQAENALISSLYKVLLDHPSFVEKCRTLDVDLVAWTVDHPDHFFQLIELGVKRIITNSLIG